MNQRWSKWVEHQLDVRNWRNVDACEASGLQPSVISSWIHQARDPSVKHLRAFAKAVDLLPPLAMIEAEYLYPEELNLPPAVPTDVASALAGASLEQLAEAFYKKLRAFRVGLARKRHGVDEALATPGELVRGLTLERDLDFYETLLLDGQAVSQQATERRRAMKEQAKAEEQLAAERKATEEMTYEELGLPIDKPEPGERDLA